MQYPNTPNGGFPPFGVFGFQMPAMTVGLKEQTRICLVAFFVYVNYSWVADTWMNMAINWWMFDFYQYIYRFNHLK